jgi:hypothetical protein
VIPVGLRNADEEEEAELGESSEKAHAADCGRRIAPAAADRRLWCVGIRRVSGILLGLTTNGFKLLGVDAFHQGIVKGGLIVASVALGSMVEGR